MDGRPEFGTQNKRGRVRTCPDCGGFRNVTVREVDMVVFLCEDCGACWRIELGYVHRVKGPADHHSDD